MFQFIKDWLLRWKQEERARDQKLIDWSKQDPHVHLEPEMIRGYLGRISGETQEQAGTVIKRCPQCKELLHKEVDFLASLHAGEMRRTMMMISRGGM
jgi:hypothetical protein